VSRTPQLRAFPKPTISTQQVPHEQLYDLETDPDELRIGLALLANATSDDPDLAAAGAARNELHAALDAWMLSQGDFLAAAPDTMPLLPANNNYLDRWTTYYNLSADLEGTLKPADYLPRNYTCSEPASTLLLPGHCPDDETTPPPASPASLPSPPT
jgi:hypothetical protein